MTNRREFLCTAAALSATPLAGRAAFAEGRELAALEAVVYDSRHPEAREFGARAALLGAPLRAIEGDVTDLWQHELLARWKAGPRAVAGLTERPALFVLERLAWEHGLRVVFEAEHEPNGSGAAAHRVLRTAAPDLAHELAAAGRGWTAVLAEAVVAGPRTRGHDFRSSQAALTAYPGEPTTLCSWVIAPRAETKI
ncbi:MAG TPA: hypothetical protein VF329_11200 [Gammaproteobacteria bacterium]